MLNKLKRQKKCAIKQSLKVNDYNNCLLNTETIYKLQHLKAKYIIYVLKRLIKLHEVVMMVHILIKIHHILMAQMLETYVK